MHAIRQHVRGVWRDRGLWLPRLLMIAFACLATLLIFGLVPIDLTIQQTLHDAENPGTWKHTDDAIWCFTRQFGSAPALITVLLALGVLIVGTRRKALQQATLPYSLFLILVLIVGPGLIVNLVLKPNWGRPRPRHVEQFNGGMPYEDVHDGGRPTIGRSFPSGHASAAYYLIALYFVFRRRRGARWIAVGAVGWGSLVGFGRMCDGAHFLSDVIWSFLVVYATCVVLWYMVFNIPAWQAGRAARLGPCRGWLVGLGTGFVMAAAFGVAVATPILRRVEMWGDPTMQVGRVTQVELRVPGAQVELGIHHRARRVHFISDLRGFGLPGANQRYRHLTNTSSGADLYMESLPVGYFSERESRIQVLVPPGQTFHFRVDDGDDGSTRLSAEARDAGMITFDVD